MSEKEIATLIEKFKNGALTKEESALLNSWYVAYAAEKNSTFDATTLSKNLSLLKEGIKKDLVDDVFNENGRTIRKISVWSKVAVAASIIISVGLGLHFLTGSISDRSKKIVVVAKTNIIKPGGNKAFLTLADGSKITLDDASEGQLASQSGIKITKAKDGQLIYTIIGDESNTSSGFNTIETPRGGQYQVNLPDGSKVWLNAATKLRFPVSFAQYKERRVELEGEAYFEVSKTKGGKKMANIPFVVSSKGQLIKVLGTHFNVKAYLDIAQTNTTLLEGSVLVSPVAQQTNRSSQQSIKLIPGQQAKLSENQIIVKSVDTESVVAWKNGQFMFTGETLIDVMKEISRWYNVDVEYKGDVSGIEIGGSVSKFSDIKQVLEILSLAGKVDIQLEKNKVIISR